MNWTFLAAIVAALVALIAIPLVGPAVSERRLKSLGPIGTTAKPAEPMNRAGRHVPDRQDRRAGGYR